MMKVCFLLRHAYYYGLGLVGWKGFCFRLLNLKKNINFRFQPRSLIQPKSFREMRTRRSRADEVVPSFPLQRNGEGEHEVKVFLWRKLPLSLSDLLCFP